MTEEEYARLRDAAAGHGARSVSEFARNTLLTTAQASAVDASWRESAQTLDDRLTKVEQEVALVKHELSWQISLQQHSQLTKK
jgi:hypothetical protein